MSAPLSTGAATANPYYSSSSGAGYSQAASVLGPSLTVTAPVFAGIPMAPDAPSDAPFASPPTLAHIGPLGPHDKKNRAHADSTCTMFREGHGGVYREGIFKDKTRWMAVLYVPPGGFREDSDGESYEIPDIFGVRGGNGTLLESEDGSAAPTPAVAAPTPAAPTPAATGGGLEWAGEGRHHFLGRFDSEEQASSAYNWALEEVRLTGTFSGRRKRPGQTAASAGVSAGVSNSINAGGVMSSSSSTGYVPLGYPYGVALNAGAPGLMPKSGSGYFP